jgi:hypothetical protein
VDRRCRVKRIILKSSTTPKPSAIRCHHCGVPQYPQTFLPDFSREVKMREKMRR